MTRIKTKPQHEVAYQELAALLKKHAEHLSSLEMLAVAANLVGKLIAMQDQRKITSEEAISIVARNIEIGNTQVIAKLADSEGEA